jgi:hypothetical protein
MSVQASDIEAPMMLLIALLLVVCVVVELARGPGGRK